MQRKRTLVLFILLCAQCRAQHFRTQQSPALSYFQPLQQARAVRRPVTAQRPVLARPVAGFKPVSQLQRLQAPHAHAARQILHAPIPLSQAQIGRPQTRVARQGFGPSIPGFDDISKLYERSMQPFLQNMLGNGQTPFYYGPPKVKFVQPGAFSSVDVRNGPVTLNPTPSNPGDAVIVYGPQPQVPLLPLYPPPPPAVVLEEETCEYDQWQNKCCNRLLKAVMKDALARLPLDTCDIGLMAKLVQKKAEDTFKMDFESLAGYKDFQIKSNYVGNLTCKINRNGKSVMAFASPNEENANPSRRLDRMQREAEERRAMERRIERIKKEVEEFQKWKNRRAKRVEPSLIHGIYSSLPYLEATSDNERSRQNDRRDPLVSTLEYDDADEYR